MTDKTRTSGWVDPLLRPVPVGTIPAHGLQVAVIPDDSERAAMAKALDLAAIDMLRGTYRLKHRSGGMVEVDGELVGTVHPICVSTLEPFPLKIDEYVVIRFAPPEIANAVSPEDMVSEDEPPDVIENGAIDLGRVTTEFLSLAIPPFPRKPGAAFAGEEGGKSESPFAALASLKAKTTDT